MAEPDEDILPDLVEVRRRITRLRRLLSDHREVYAALADADVSRIAGADDEGFKAVASSRTRSTPSGTAGISCWGRSTC